MAYDIPKQGIQAYMDGMVQKFGPGNWWWRKYERARDILVVLLVITVLGGLAGVWLEKTEMGFLMVSVGGLCVIVMLAFIALQVAPIRWYRYSLADFMRYYDYITPDLDRVIRQVRAQNPEAEFEVELLKSRSGEKESFVLFQVLDILGPVPENKGKPIAIFEGYGTQQQFGDAWAPHGATA